MSDSPVVQKIYKPWGECLATFFVFLMVGPPIGGIVFALTMALLPSVSGVPFGDGSDTAGQISVGIFIGLFAIPFSYMVGGLQAAAMGLAHAVYGWFRGRQPFWFAAVMAAVVFAGSLISGMADASELFFPMLLVHVIPALLCWLIARSFWRRYQP